MDIQEDLSKNLNKAAQFVIDSQKSIATESFEIRGNLLRLNSTLIPLSSISKVSLYSESIPFPVKSIIMGVIGFLLLKKFAFIPYSDFVFDEIIDIGAWSGLLLMASSIIWILSWVLRNANLKAEIQMVLLLNSGGTFSIIFNNKNFLYEVYLLISDILANPTNHGNYFIDVHNNTLNAITDNTFNDNSSAIHNTRK